MVSLHVLPLCFGPTPHSYGNVLDRFLEVEWGYFRPFKRLQIHRIPFSGSSMTSARMKTPKMAPKAIDRSVIRSNTVLFPLFGLILQPFVQIFGIYGDFSSILIHYKHTLAFQDQSNDPGGGLGAGVAVPLIRWLRASF